MSDSELIRQLNAVLEKGFDDSFASFCARILASNRYASDGLARVRMHAHYLRLAIEALTDPVRREELFRQAGAGDRMDDAFLKVTMESYRAALESDRPFCEVFVERWCSYYAIPASSLTEGPNG